MYSQQAVSGHSVHLEYSCAAFEVSTIGIFGQVIVTFFINEN